MPATTPNLALPYPLGTDRVMDGDDAIHSLATALDGTAWVGIAAFANGWTNFGGGYQAARYRKQAGELWLEGVIRPGGNGAAAFTLPAGFVIPATTLAVAGASTGAAYVYMDTTGAVVPSFVAGAAWVSMSVRLSLI